MDNSKKGSDEFINEIIIPIEQNNPDMGKLFVLMRSRPNQTFTDYEDVLKKDDGIENWSFPKDSGLGEWIEGDQIKLETLSGLIWRGVEGGRLYKAEFEGEKKIIGPRHYFDISIDPNPDVAGKKFIDECISLGIEVKKARLISRINNWRPYLLWSFALDCVERAYSHERNLASEIYRDAIIFARAYSRFVCGIGGIELESIVQASQTNRDFELLCEKKKSELMSLLSDQSELGSTVYLRKAVLEAFKPDKPFQVANLVRTAMAWHYLGEYRKEYAYPSMVSQLIEEKRIITRVWYAFHKKELEWQVSHLGKLMGE